MARKVKLNLTVSGGDLWWSADGGVNWAVVGPKSPVTVVKKDFEVQWICDDSTIDDIEIILDSGDVLEPPSGSRKEITCKVNQKCKDKDVSKYTISVNGGKFKIDPEVKMCNPPCPPGVGG